MENQNNIKKLYKSEKDQILSGVIGGVAEYFNIDSTLLRLGFVVLVLITGIFPGIIAYIIAFFIVPEKPHHISTLVNPSPMKTEQNINTEKDTPKTEEENKQ